MKIVVKVFFLIVLLLIGIVVDSMAPVITNDLAMTQLENSDALLVTVNTYNQIRPVVSISYGIIVCLFAFSLARDLMKFAKSE